MSGSIRLCVQIENRKCVALSQSCLRRSGEREKNLSIHRIERLEFAISAMIRLFFYLMGFRFCGVLCDTLVHWYKESSNEAVVKWNRKFWRIQINRSLSKLFMLYKAIKYHWRQFVWRRNILLL